MSGVLDMFESSPVRTGFSRIFEFVLVGKKWALVMKPFSDLETLIAFARAAHGIFCFLVTVGPSVSYVEISLDPIRVHTIATLETLPYEVLN